MEAVLQQPGVILSPLQGPMGQRPSAQLQDGDVGAGEVQCHSSLHSARLFLPDPGRRRPSPPPPPETLSPSRPRKP